jgi:hypothetical protein
MTSTSPPARTPTPSRQSEQESGSSDDDESPGKYTKNRVDYRDLAQLFFLPENEAAEKLSISKSKLKRLKKKKSIQRWPYRRVNSIISLEFYIL